MLASQLGTNSAVMINLYYEGQGIVRLLRSVWIRLNKLTHCNLAYTISSSVFQPGRLDARPRVETLVEWGGEHSAVRIRKQQEFAAISTNSTIEK